MNMQDKVEGKYTNKLPFGVQVLKRKTKKIGKRRFGNN